MTQLLVGGGGGEVFNAIFIFIGYCIFLLELSSSWL